MEVSPCIHCYYVGLGVKSRLSKPVMGKDYSYNYIPKCVYSDIP